MDGQLQGGIMLDPKKKVLKMGECICFKEPRGENGLEGYQKSLTYKYHLVEHNDIKWFRLWPDTKTDYFERASVGIFSKFFKYYEES